MSPSRTVGSCILTFRPHSNAQTFLQPTLLTFPPHVHIDFTVRPVFTLVHSILRDTPPEESFTAFASERVVVVPRRSVTAHQAEFLLLPRRRSFLLFTGVAAVDAVAVQ